MLLHLEGIEGVLVTHRAVGWDALLAACTLKGEVEVVGVDMARAEEVGSVYFGAAGAGTNAGVGVETGFVEAAAAAALSLFTSSAVLV